MSDVPIPLSPITTEENADLHFYLGDPPVDDKNGANGEPKTKAMPSSLVTDNMDVLDPPATNLRSSLAKIASEVPRRHSEVCMPPLTLV